MRGERFAFRKSCESTAPVLEHQETRWWNTTLFTESLQRGGLGCQQLCYRERDRERKASNKIAEKMLKHSEHSPVLGCRGYWTEAARVCCHSLAAPQSPSSATASYQQQCTLALRCTARLWAGKAKWHKISEKF